MKEVCEICLHPITDPICVNCYLRHSGIWLRDFGLHQKEIDHIIYEIKSRLPLETLNEHRCVSCNRQEVSICMFCAFLKTSKVLLKHANQENRESYIKSTNFAREDNI